MKWLIQNASLACGMFVALSFPLGAIATPVATPFLQVDINGDVAAPDEGVTAVGFQNWDFTSPPDPPQPNDSTASQTFGDVTVTITFHTYDMVGSRDRGLPLGGPLDELYRDFIFVPRNDNALGLDGFTYEFSGLAASSLYEFTFWSYDNNNGAIVNRMAYSFASPLDTYPNGYIPGNVGDCPICGPDPPVAAYSVLGGGGGTGPPLDPYDFSASIQATSNASGVVTIYSWNASLVVDGSTQMAGIVNGFAVGKIPEPTTLVLLGLGVPAMGLSRKRMKPQHDQWSN